ncbi:DUF1289 domain-containing protein [Blastomonas sp.]|uniref:DUF1289 domain-containing protein n=1 Tax=Blastomonas sp. TaxID=1909299 RepID=UPI0035932FF5
MGVERNAARRRMSVVMASSDTGVASPCNGVCTIHHQLGLCEGCGRTLDEIAEWSTASVARRQTILQALPARRAILTQS